MLAPFGAAAAVMRDLDLVVGGYAHEGNVGLRPLGYRPAADRWTSGAPTTDVFDASFAVYNPRFGLLYVVEERTAGMIAALRRDANGRWQRVAQLSSCGSSPCHLAIDYSGRLLAVANYGSGSVALFRLSGSSGLPLGQGEQRGHQGSGPNLRRQLSAHAHWVGFTANGQWLQAVDLGADAVFAYPYDLRTDSLGQGTIAYKAKPGTGPRHLVRHPELPVTYLVNELDNSITTLRNLAGDRLEEIGTVSSLPPDFAGRSAAAEIAIGLAGTRLYVSNRGHDSLAVFGIERDGTLRLMQHIPSGGRSPRHFLLIESEGRVIVANEGSGRLETFHLEPDGRLSHHGAGLEVPGVTFVGRT